MKTITLETTSSEGKTLKAVFLPEKGMNLCSFTSGDIEAIDQSTRKLFEQQYAGLGPLIGPHFHRRPLHLIPKGIDEKKFPHAVYFKGDPRPDPFSHGIGRYAPWNVETSGNSFQAILSGKDSWEDIPLSALEGQDFKMQFSGSLSEKGLSLELSVVSEKDSLVGIHYYYSLPKGKGTIYSVVKNSFIEDNEKKPLPNEWDFDTQHRLRLPLDEGVDFTFFPHPNPLEGKIVLDAGNHEIVTTYQSDSAENSWQLWHPKGASFVCIEPISSQDPRHPNLTVSSIKIQLEIVDKR